MDEIHITDGEKIMSRIVAGEGPADILPLLEGYRQVYMVCDAVLSGGVGAVFDNVLGMSDLFGMRYRGCYGLEASEKAKNMDAVTGLCRWLMENDADRDALLVAVGGGITTDIAGFAASVYKRGIRFANVPTTLLGQVDAAIGGKTGVNLDSYKNIMGVICQPEFVFLCPAVLETLDRRNLLCGVAEMLKTFIIGDKDNYAAALRLFGLHSGGNDGFAKAHSAEILRLVHAAAAVKAEIVSRDMFEKGERKVLNLGHTFAHAVEHCAALEGADIRHGEAVSMGIIMAAAFSERSGTASSGLAQRLKEDFAGVGLPVECPFGMRELVQAMRKDKKAESEMINLVLIEDIGNVIVRKICRYDLYQYK